MGKRIETIETIIATIILLCFIGFVIYIFSAIREIFINVVYKKTLTEFEREKRDERDKKSRQRERDNTLSNISSFRSIDMYRICSELDFITNTAAYIDYSTMTDIQLEKVVKERKSSFLYNEAHEYKDIYVDKVPLIVTNANQRVICCSYKNDKIQRKSFDVVLKIDEESTYSTYKINPVDYSKYDLIEVSGFLSAGDSYGLYISIDKINKIRIIEHNHKID